MRGTPWRGPLVAQAAAGQAFWVGFRLVVGYRALDLGAGPAFLGLLAAASAAPALLAAVPVGRLADRLGGIGVAAAGLLTSAVGTALALLGPDRATLSAAVVVTGLGQLAVVVGQQAFVAHVSAGGPGDAAFGTMTAAASVGQLLGPPAVTTALATAPSLGLDRTDAGLLACLLLLAPALPGLHRLRRADRGLREGRRPRDGARTGTRELLGVPGMWRSLAVSGAVLVTVDLLYTFVPVWATEQGVAATTVGWLLALRAAVSVVTRVGLARLVARFGRPRLILVSVLGGAVSLAVLPLVGAPGAVAVMVGLGIALGLPQPLTMAWVVSLGPASASGAVLGLRLTSNRLAQVTLPLLVGAALGPFGVGAVFWANAALLLGAAVIVPPRRGPDGPP